MKLGIKKLYEDAKLPTKGTEHASCFDFYVHRIERIDEDKAILYLGVACEIPKGYSLILKPRSSFCLKGWFQANTPGEVDEDYKGELQMRIQAIPNYYTPEYYDESGYRETGSGRLEYPELPFMIGDRCIQGKLEVKIPTEIEEVFELSETERGSSGFGSTGK